MLLSENEIEAILKRFKIVACQHIEANALKNYSFEAERDFETEGIVLRLFHRPFGEIITKIRYPANWKEAVKEAFFNWINKQYGKYLSHSNKPRDSLVLLDIFKLVKYKWYDVVAYYPQITLPNEENVMTFKPTEVHDETVHN